MPIMMRMIRKNLCPALLLALLFALMACTAKQSVVADNNNSSTAIVNRANAQKQSLPCLTARVGVEISQGQKNISCSGTLRMKRDEVVQLSLSLLGFEVGRLECTPTEVLLIDRVNKQYIRAPYSEVDFLQAAGLDFYALQALLRAELFVPGSRNTEEQASRFKTSDAGNHTMLSLTDAPELDYTFLLQQTTATISRFEATPKTASDNRAFVCRYNNYTSLNNRPVPGQIDMEVKGLEAPLQLSLSLSRYNNNDNWELHTTPKSSYKQLTNTRQIIARLLQLSK